MQCNGFFLVDLFMPIQGSISNNMFTEIKKDTVCLIKNCAYIQKNQYMFTISGTEQPTKSVNMDLKIYSKLTKISVKYVNKHAKQTYLTVVFAFCHSANWFNEHLFVLFQFKYMKNKTTKCNV